MIGSADAEEPSLCCLLCSFHCYAGGVSNQSVFHDAYPTVPIWFTECSQTGNENSPRQFSVDFFDNYDGLYAGNLNNWGRTVLHWTMAVDLSLGPHSGGCGTCSGVVTVDAGNTSRPYLVKYNSEYYSLAHFSALLPPMSTRVASAVTAAGRTAMQVVTAVTPDGSTVVQVGYQGAADTPLFVVDEVAGLCFQTSLAAGSLTSFKWPRSGAPAVASADNGASDRPASGWATAVMALLALVLLS